MNRINNIDYAAIAAYNVVGVAVGVARVAAAVYYIAKHCFNELICNEKAEMRASAVNQHFAKIKVQRAQENAQGGIFTRARNIANQAVDSVVKGLDNVAQGLKGAPFKSQVKLSKQAWTNELIRGFTEMIPLIGSAIYTHDALSNKNADVIGWAHFEQLRENSNTIDSMVSW